MGEWTPVNPLIIDLRFAEQQNPAMVEKLKRALPMRLIHLEGSLSARISAAERRFPSFTDPEFLSGTQWGWWLSAGRLIRCRSVVQFFLEKAVSEVQT